VGAHLHWLFVGLGRSVGLNHILGCCTYKPYILVRHRQRPIQRLLEVRWAAVVLVQFSRICMPATIVVRGENRPRWHTRTFILPLQESRVSALCASAGFRGFSHIGETTAGLSVDIQAPDRSTTVALSPQPSSMPSTNAPAAHTLPRPSTRLSWMKNRVISDYTLTMGLGELFSSFAHRTTHSSNV